MHHPRNLPVRVSAAGVKDFLHRGGLLLLYKPGCPYCEDVYRHNDTESTLAKVAARVHGQGDNRFVCVANGPRVRQSLDVSIQNMIGTYPTFIVHGPEGTRKHEGERTVDTLHAVATNSGINSVWATAAPPGAPPTSEWARDDPTSQFTARQIALDTGTRFVPNTMEASAFVQRNDGVLALVSNIQDKEDVKKIAKHNLVMTNTVVPIGVGEMEQLRPGLAKELRDHIGKDPKAMLVCIAGQEVIYAKDAEDAVAIMMNKKLIERYV